MAFSSGTDWSFETLHARWKKDRDTADAVESDVDTEEEPDEQSSPHEAPPAREPPQLPPRQCRICLDLVYARFDDADFGSALPKTFQSRPRVVYESEDGGRLLSPCQCRGTQKYVHEDCLGSWRRADPMQKRNYWQCPTCHYRYRLQRLTWASWLSSTISQISLTVLIFLSCVFVLGFVADPIINLCLDPVTTIATAGGPTGSLIYEDEPASWAEHFLKGMASIGLLGFAKFMFTLSPFNFLNNRGLNIAMGRGSATGSGRDRLSQTTWIVALIGIMTFLYTVWKGVRAWSRKTLEHASERVLDVHHDDDEADDGQANGHEGDEYQRNHNEAHESHEANDHARDGSDFD